MAFEVFFCFNRVTRSHISDANCGGCEMNCSLLCLHSTLMARRFCFDFLGGVVSAYPSGLYFSNPIIISILPSNYHIGRAIEG